MSEQRIEFKQLDAKRVGTDTVVFRLEDGTAVNIKVDLDRAGVALTYKNPDGTPHYNIGASLKVTVVPKGKSYYVSKSRIQSVPMKKRKNSPFIR